MAKNNPYSTVNITFKDNVLYICGALTFFTVAELFLKSKKFILENKVIKIDLSGIDIFDSAAICFLVELISLAKTKKLKFIFFHIPDKLNNIITVFTLNDLIAKFN